MKLWRSAGAHGCGSCAHVLICACAHVRGAAVRWLRWNHAMLALMHAAMLRHQAPLHQASGSSRHQVSAHLFCRTMQLPSVS